MNSREASCEASEVAGVVDYMPLPRTTAGEKHKISAGHSLELDAPELHLELRNESFLTKLPGTPSELVQLAYYLFALLSIYHDTMYSKGLTLDPAWGKENITRETSSIFG